MTYKNPMRIVAATFAVTATIALTGCFSNPLESLQNQISGGSGEQIAENLIENLTGGEMAINVGELPADFPKEVPLISDNVLSSTQVEIENGVIATQVVIQDSRTITETAEVVRADFADWEEISWGDLAGVMYNGQFQKNGIAVMVGVMEGDDSDSSTVSYMVYTE